jgi:hypothetical protein
MNTLNIFVGKERCHLGDLSVDGKIILGDKDEDSSGPRQGRVEVFL